jgi:hypothetical protein
MEPLFEKYVNRMLDYVRLNLHPVMYNEQVSMCCICWGWWPGQKRSTLIGLLAAVIEVPDT